MFSLSSTCIAALAVLTLSACSTSSPAAHGRDIGRDIGRDLANWELVATPGVPLADAVTLRDGGVLALGALPAAYLATTASYTDYRLHFDWRWRGKAGNGGALLHIASGPRDRAWPLSVQVQTKHGSVGDVLPMAGARFDEALTSAPGAATAIKAHTAPDSEKPVGEWNSCDVVSRGGTIEVRINGVLQNTVTRVSPAAGRIGFQFEGTPYDIRDVRVSTL